MTIHRDYPCNPRNHKDGRTQRVAFLVYHYVGALGDAKQNARYYHRTPGLGASAHYFVGHAEENADVWASVDEGDTAWHCGRSGGRYKHPECRNANSIGIELCCHRDAAGSWYIDPETLDRGAELGRDIMARYGIPIDNVLRHYDVTGKICPAPLVHDEAAWAAFKGRLAAQEGEIDMTHGEMQAAIKQAVEAEFAARDAVVADAAQRVSPWAAEAWEKAAGKGVFDGTRPGGNITREQVAVVLDRLGLLDREV